jgi:HEAT repeat protein
MRWINVALAVAFASLALALEAPAYAQKPPPRPLTDLGATTKKLKSGEENQIKEGLDEVRAAGTAGAPAVPAVADTLSKGLSAPLTEAAIETLGEVESEAGTSALVLYATHRNAKIRRAAVKALTRTRGAAAAPVLKRALSDSDAVVRGTAASGLGALKAKDAVPQLFIALDHRVNEAAASIGQLCGPEQCIELASRMGKLPFDIVIAGLDSALFRQELPDDTKVKIIGRIREIGTVEANKFLRDVQKRWPQGGSARIKQSLDQAVQATSGGTQ